MVYLVTLLFFLFLPVQNIYSVEPPVETVLVKQNIIDSENYENEDDVDEIEQCLNETDKPEEKIESFISIMDIPYAYISSGIESTVRNIDEYFSDDKITYKTSGSYLLLRQNMTFTEGGVIRSKNDIYFNFRLPNTEKKLKIFFETNNNQFSNSSTQSTVTGDSQYITGVQGSSGEKFGWKYRPTLGLRLNSSIDSFIRFKFNSEYNFNKWTFNWYETPYWDSRIGWGFDSYFELIRKIHDKHVFRMGTFVGWRQDTREYNTSHVVSMYHSFDDKNTLSYYAGVYGLRDSTLYTTRFLLGLNYRRKIYKNYLFIGLVPEVLYQKENSFKPEHSLTIRLEMFFNN